MAVWEDRPGRDASRAACTCPGAGSAKYKRAMTNGGVGRTGGGGERAPVACVGCACG